MPTPYQITNAFRTVYYELVKPPKKVGSFAVLPPAGGNGKIPHSLAYSKVVFGNSEYWETSPVVFGRAGVNSGVPGSGSDNVGHSLERLSYHHQTHGAIVGVEERPKNAYITDPNGTNIHRFPVVG